MDAPSPGPDITRAVEAAGEIHMSRACQDKCRWYAKAYLSMVREDQLLKRTMKDAKDEEERREIESAKAKWRRPKPLDISGAMETAISDLGKAHSAVAGLVAKPDLPPERRQTHNDLLIRYRRRLNEVASLAVEIQNAADNFATHHWPTPGALRDELGVKRHEPFRLWVVWTAQAWRDDGLKPTAGRVGKGGWRTSPFQRFLWAIWESVADKSPLTREQFAEKAHNALRSPKREAG